MGMPLELNTMIVTKQKEIKTETENVYELVKEGYRLYPIDIPIEVRTTKEGTPYAHARICKLTWEQEKTILTYELMDLLGVN
ncbi:DUF2584 family protein [Pullulanibacillus sp. KACC 23026]|uniref:DUF2584 family protein n=1 Tax=Pullulanibacillus sp. KACC 23026 TaxID=3028315 RepID=UPI0023B13590|nr:DUF2584 family protein [Pullulanibacillus sp. KACC 23026]WEG11806.1 DUF2584 family protein [Pullulanibacillus sp. KACC 23026]